MTGPEPSMNESEYPNLLKAKKYPSWVNDPGYTEYYKTHKICPVCNEVVGVADAVKRGWRFYHKECAPPNSKEHPCAQCGKPTTKVKWCSRKCKNEYLGVEHMRCVVCGNLTRWTKTVAKSTGRTYPTCSDECKRKWHSSDEYWNLRYKPFTGVNSLFGSPEFREKLASGLQSNQLYKVAVRKRRCDISEDEYNERWHNIQDPSYVMEHCSCNGVYIPDMFKKHFFTSNTTEIKYRKLLCETDPEHFAIKTSTSHEQLALYQKLVYNFVNLEFKLEITGPKNPLTGGTFRFDIGCFKDGELLCAIEYDGVWFHTEKNPKPFIKGNMERDRAKDALCREMGIKLFRVRSDHYDSDYNALTGYLGGL